MRRRAAAVALGLLLAAPAPALAAAPSPAPLSFPVAAALCYGTPLAVGLGGGLLGSALGNQPVVASAVGTLVFASLSSGYVYAGDPARGGLVALGELGALTAALLVSGGVAVAIAGPGQGAGFIIPLVGAPIVGATWVGYNVWKMRDLGALVERKNREALGFPPEPR